MVDFPPVGVVYASFVPPATERTVIRFRTRLTEATNVGWSSSGWSSTIGPPMKVNCRLRALPSAPMGSIQR